MRCGHCVYFYLRLVLYMNYSCLQLLGKKVIQLVQYVRYVLEDALQFLLSFFQSHKKRNPSMSSSGKGDEIKKKKKVQAVAGAVKKNKDIKKRKSLKERKDTAGTPVDDDRSELSVGNHDGDMALARGTKIQQSKG